MDKDELLFKNRSLQTAKKTVLIIRVLTLNKQRKGSDRNAAVFQVKRRRLSLETPPRFDRNITTFFREAVERFEKMVLEIEKAVQMIRKSNLGDYEKQYRRLEKDI